MPITNFTYHDEHGYTHTVLSNFYMGYGFTAPHYDGGKPVFWRSGEHYYQAAKASTPEAAERIRLTKTAGAAKKAGRSTPLRLGWETIKLDVMRRTLAAKFAPGTPEAAYLMSTADFVLIEGNDWGDSFWGLSDGRGDNWLGWLLMAQRSYLLALDAEEAVQSDRLIEKTETEGAEPGGGVLAQKGQQVDAVALGLLGCACGGGCCKNQRC